MKLTVIGSGSSGNCYVLQNEKTALVIEAGMSLALTKRYLEWNLSKVAGCIISHQHNDHAGYAKEYEKAGIPLLALPEVIQAKRLTNATPIEHGRWYTIGEFQILPFPLLHDVPTVGFLIEHEATGRILFATDTYALSRLEMTPRGKEKYIKYNFGGVVHWMIEANYSDNILRRNIENGNIPEKFRERLMVSHMSIVNCKNTLKRMDTSSTRDIMLIHLSDGNSNERRFVKSIREATGKRTFVARQGLQVDYDLEII